MGVFDTDKPVTGIYIESKGFERITKNTWRLHTSKRGADYSKWWRLPVIIDYDIKRKMFRIDFKQKYFIEDRMEFDLVFDQIVKDTDYEQYRSKYEYIR